MLVTAAVLAALAMPQADTTFPVERSQRLDASAHVGSIAVRTWDRNAVRVRAELGGIRVPTLVLHRQGDRDMQIEEGRYLARHIPGARFVELPGIDHLPWAGDPEPVLQAIEAFVREVGG